MFPTPLREMLEKAGFEVGIHGLEHDGKLYSSKAKFAAKALRIREYAQQWNAVRVSFPFDAAQFTVAARTKRWSMTRPPSIQIRLNLNRMASARSFHSGCRARMATAMSSFHTRSCRISIFFRFFAKRTLTSGNGRLIGLPKTAAWCC